MSRTSRWVASLALLLLSISCATAPPPPSPRDQFPLDPREGLTGPFPPGIQEGWEALLAGNTARARTAFSGAQSGGAEAAAEIGLIEALVVGGNLPEALAACRRVLPGAESSVPFLTACGEAHARSGQALEALDLYRRALAWEAGNRPGLQRRARELQAQASEQLRRQAQEAAGHQDWAAARQAADRAVELAPQSARALETAGDIDLESGDRSAALTRYSEALDLEPQDRTLQEKVARLALALSDYAAAIPALDALAAEDPRYAGEAEKARLAFRVANWPVAVQDAAHAARLTRGEAALLLWWMVPEVREAKVSTSEIASDVLGRPDSQEIQRAVGLGLLDVDRETHRASPDAPMTLSAASSLYLRVLGLLAPEAPPACLSGRLAQTVAGSPSILRARECKIVGEGEASAVSGSAFLRSLDRVRALASPGDNASGDRGAQPQ